MSAMNLQAPGSFGGEGILSLRDPGQARSLASEGLSVKGFARSLQVLPAILSLAHRLFITTTSGNFTWSATNLTIPSLPLHTHTHTHTHTHIYAHSHTHTHTHIHFNLSIALATPPKSHRFVVDCCKGHALLGRIQSGITL